jgi:hypothetical protein
MVLSANTSWQTTVSFVHAENLNKRKKGFRWITTEAKLFSFSFR